MLLLNSPEFFQTRGKYLANRAKFPVEELRKFAGKWIAWSADGSRIAACADTEEQLSALLAGSGAAAHGCIIEGMPATDVDTYLGGFWIGDSA